MYYRDCIIKITKLIPFIIFRKHGSWYCVEAKSASCIFILDTIGLVNCCASSELSELFFLWISTFKSIVELGLSRLYSDVILSASAFCTFDSIKELRDEHSTGGVSVFPKT